MTGGDGEYGWNRAYVPGLVDPSQVASLKGSGRIGVVKRGRQIHFENDHGVMKLESSDIPNGTRVLVKYHPTLGGCYARPLEEYARAKRAKRSEREAEEDRKSRERHRRRREAEAFWDSYELPFEHDVAVKGRLSGLSRGSTGDGRTRRTVTHCFVREAFQDGRLARGPDSYLCDNSANYRFDGERHLDGDDNEYMPQVTCNECQRIMDRWKTTETGGGD